MKGILIIGIIISLASCGVYSDSGNPKVDTNKDKSVATGKGETEELAEEKARTGSASSTARTRTNGKSSWFGTCYCRKSGRW